MKLFNFKKEPQTVIVCIHGFGQRQQDEFIPLVNYFNKYEVITPELYDIHDPRDDEWVDWVYRAEHVLDEAASQGKRIILIGFSMGGVLASYCASKANVDKLVLIAPAFEYVNLPNATGFVTSLFEKKDDTPSSYPELPPNFTITFANLVNNCKPAIEDIHIPTLIIHGSDDDVILHTSSKKFIKKIPTEEKALITIEGVKHRVLDHPIGGKIALENIQLFMNNKIVVKNQ